MKKEGCGFCYEQRWPHFAEMGRSDLSKYVVAENDVWIAKPDILPAHPDGLHFVMRPKDHHLNYMEADPMELGRFLHGIEQEFGPLTIMKHGDVQEETASVMSIRHDHTHLFPNVDIRAVDYMRDIVDAQGIAHEVIDAPDASYILGLQSAFKGHPYIYVQQGGVGLFVNDEHEQLGSQQIQRAMQRHFNGVTFNWKELDKHPEYKALSTQRISNLIQRRG